MFLLLHLALGEMTFNVALMNSGLVGKTARFVTQNYSGFDFTQDIENDYNALKNDQVAWTILHENLADLLILLTDSRYGTTFGYADPEFGCGIVSVGYLGAPRYTFAHEIGHLLKARHNRITNGGDATDDINCYFGYKFPFLLNTVGYTIMAKLAENDGSRTLVYSNPSIEILGYPTGTEENNNAGVISKSFCPLASFYNTGELAVDISGPGNIACNGSGTYTTTITPPDAGIPGVAPYQYSWIVGEAPFKSLTGPGTIQVGTSATITLNSNNIPYDNFWLFLNILSSDGVMANDLVLVNKIPCGPERSIALPFTDNGNNDFKFSVSPNPTQDHILLNFNASDETSVLSYNILNNLGQVMISGKIQQISQEMPVTLPSGVYNLRIFSSTVHASQKLIINN